MKAKVGWALSETLTGPDLFSWSQLSSAPFFTGVECWVLSVECWVLSVECWVSSVQHWVSRVECWMSSVPMSNIESRCFWVAMSPLWAIKSFNKHHTLRVLLIKCQQHWVLGVKYWNDGQGDGTVISSQGCSVGSIKHWVFWHWVPRIAVYQCWQHRALKGWVSDGTVTSEFARLQMLHQCWASTLS
jgi:hypothetical protein